METFLNDPLSISLLKGGGELGSGPSARDVKRKLNCKAGELHNPMIMIGEGDLRIAACDKIPKLFLDQPWPSPKL